jgi:DNA-binding NarL/FixJ family response regulator
MSVAIGTLRSAPRPGRPRQAGRREARRAPNSPIRLVLGDDRPLSRAGIMSVLRDAGVEVVALANNAGDLTRKSQAYHPDVVVVDLDMPPELSDDEWAQVVRSVRSIDPRMGILILSQLPKEQLVRAALDDQPQGFGYLVKERIRSSEDFTACVSQVARGGTAIDPAVLSRLAGRRRTSDPIDDLTNRERQVLALIAEGRSNRYIANELVVTTPAVERHITSIFAKLDLPPNPADHRRVLAVLRYISRFGLGPQSTPAVT